MEYFISILFAGHFQIILYKRYLYVLIKMKSGFKSNFTERIENIGDRFFFFVSRAKIKFVIRNF